MPSKAATGVVFVVVGAAIAGGLLLFIRLTRDDFEEVMQSANGYTMLRGLETYTAGNLVVRLKPKPWCVPERV